MLLQYKLENKQELLFKKYCGIANLFSLQAVCFLQILE